MTSAEIVVEFVKGRPDLERVLRKKMTDAFCAPEMYAPKCADLVHDAFSEVTEEEKALLDKVRGNDDVDWTEVARTFGAPLDPKTDSPSPKPKTYDWSKLRALGIALAKDSSALTAALAEFEKRILGLDIGIEVSVPLDAESQLFFGKQGSKWGLFVITPVLGQRQKNTVSLQNTSRAVRIRVAHQTLALLARLVEESERMVGEVRDAGERVAEAIEIADEVKRGA